MGLMKALDFHSSKLPASKSLFLSDFSASGTTFKLANESRGKAELNIGRLLCTFSLGSCPFKMLSKGYFFIFYPAFLVHSL